MTRVERAIGLLEKLQKIHRDHSYPDEYYGLNLDGPCLEAMILAIIQEVDAWTPGRMELKYKYEISCDRCRAYNKDLPDEPQHHFFCYVVGVCPGAAEDPEERARLYRAQLEHAVRKGSARRIG